jgi:hypothetical protein
VAVARKSTQVGCPLRITHAPAVARRTIAREQVGTLLDLLRPEFRRARCEWPRDRRTAQNTEKALRPPWRTRGSPAQMLRIGVRTWAPASRCIFALALTLD